MNKDFELACRVDKIRIRIDEVLELIHSLGHGVSSPALYDVLTDLLKQVDNLVEFLEDNDENMKVGKLGSADEYFKGDPITDYINARLDFLQGNGDKETAIKAMEKAAKEIQGTQEGGCTGDPATCQETVCCFTECFGPCKIDDPNCVCRQNEEENTMELTLHEYIKMLDEDYTEEINDALDDIERVLGNVPSEAYDEEDVALIRFYLRHLPINSAADIEALSDRAAVLAFKQRMYTLGKLG